MRTLNQVNLKAQLLSVRIFTFCFSLFFTDLKGLNTAIIFYINDTIILCFFFKYFFVCVCENLNVFNTDIIQMGICHSAAPPLPGVSNQNHFKEELLSVLIPLSFPMWHLEFSALGAAFCNCSTNKQPTNWIKTTYSNDPTLGLAAVMQWASYKEQHTEQQSPYAQSRGCTPPPAACAGTCRAGQCCRWS